MASNDKIQGLGFGCGNPAIKVTTLVHSALSSNPQRIEIRFVPNKKIQNCLTIFLEEHYTPLKKDKHKRIPWHTTVVKAEQLTKLILNRCTAVKKSCCSQQAIFLKPIS
jgi:hypothetical protein